MIIIFWTNYLEACETFLSGGNKTLVEFQEMRQQLSKLLLLHWLKQAENKNDDFDYDDNDCDDNDHDDNDYLHPEAREIARGQSRGLTMTMTMIMLTMIKNYLDGTNRSSPHSFSTALIATWSVISDHGGWFKERF